jgi:hypothetical protein
VTKWPAELRAPVVILGLDAAQRLIGRQLEFGHLTIREGTRTRERRADLGMARI